jgi:hypothetical protein
MKRKLQPGDTVRVVGERGTAKVRAILSSMHGALFEGWMEHLRVLFETFMHVEFSFASRRSCSQGGTTHDCELRRSCGPASATPQLG